MNAPAGLPPFEDAGGAAVVLAALLSSSPGPATAMMEWWSQARLRADIVVRADRELTMDEHDQLAAGAIISGHERRGRLVTGDGTVAASVWLLLLQPRIPAPAWRLLADTDTPAGRVLDAYGFRRTWRQAVALHAAAGETAIRSSALLRVGGVPAGLVREEITGDFCLLAARNARPDYL